jgi:hypothetical protein
MSALPRWSVACIYGFGLALAALLLIQHWVHVTPYLYWVILLACPLMHLFMLRGHHHRHNKPSAGSGSERP